MHGYAPLLLCYFLFHSYSIRVIKKYNYNVLRIREFIKEYSFINEIVSCSRLNDRLLSMSLVRSNRPLQYTCCWSNKLNLLSQLFYVIVYVIES